MTINSIDHIEDGLDKLTSIFSDAEDLKNLLAVLLKPFDDLEEELLKLSEQKNLDTAEGIWLDYLGYILGELRAGRDDQTYRKALRFRIAINKADGTYDSIYNIVKTYTESEKVRVATGILSYGQIIFDGQLNADKTLYEVIQDITPVGVELKILQDTNGTSALPFWEVNLPDTEKFQIKKDNGSIFDFEVKLDDGTIEAFYVSPSGGLTTYDPNTPLEGSIFEWEEGDFLELNTGGFLELKLDDGTIEPLTLAGTSTKKGLTPLPWEINVDAFTDTLEGVGELSTNYGVGFAARKTAPNLEQFRVRGIRT